MLSELTKPRSLPKRRIFRGSLMPMLLLALALLPLAGARAQDGDAAIKERMRERLPHIARLKETAVVGEALTGYLEIRDAAKATADDKKTVAEENADRKKLYEALAKKVGSDASRIGAARAKMIYQREQSGALIQKPDGTWYPKP